jgi:hypothetical protein
MDLEARSLPVSVKTPLLNKLRDYKVRRSGRAQRHRASTRALTRRCGADEPGVAQGEREEGWRGADGH